MSKLRVRRPSPALVLAFIALLATLGGTAWAAKKIGTKQIKANSITTGKIKKNAVTTAKIKGNAVTGAKVKESSLGTVPSAQVANTLAPGETVHFVGAPGEPPFEGGSQNIPGSPEVPYTFNPVAFYKDHEGIVHLEGVAEVGVAGLGVVFTLPPGFRPASNKIIPWNLAYFTGGETSPGGETVFGEVESGETLVVGSGVVSGGLDLSGKIIGEPEGFVILDGLTFRAQS